MSLEQSRVEELLEFVGYAEAKADRWLHKHMPWVFASSSASRTRCLMIPKYCSWMTGQRTGSNKMRWMCSMLRSVANEGGTCVARLYTFCTKSRWASTELLVIDTKQDRREWFEGAADVRNWITHCALRRKSASGRYIAERSIWSNTWRTVVESMSTLISTRWGRLLWSSRWCWPHYARPIRLGWKKCFCS